MLQLLVLGIIIFVTIKVFKWFMDDPVMPPTRYYVDDFNEMSFNNQRRRFPAMREFESGGRTLSNISHKGGLGNSNWNQYRQRQGMVTAESGAARLPLMRAAGDGGQSQRVLAQGRANRSSKLTKFVAMDCEMVGAGVNGCISILARVSMVNSNGDCVYDKYVKPTMKITDYRTFVSGIRPHDLVDGEDFATVKEEVADILRHRILVGHALKHDLEALTLYHAHKYTRDTITFNKFREEHCRTMSLKNLTKQFLNVNIQDGEHDSVEDARAAMMLYMTYRKEWEAERHNNYKNFI